MSARTAPATSPRARVDDLVCAVGSGQGEPLLHDVHGDRARAHRARDQRRAETDRPLAEDRDRVATGELQPAERGERRPCAARRGGAVLEAERVGQRNERVGSRGHELGVGAVGGDAVGPVWPAQYFGEPARQWMQIAQP